MTDEEIAKLKTQQYSKGYAAGRKKLEADEKESERMRRKNAFYNQALLAAISACIRAEGWTRGGKPISGCADKVSMAHDFASELTNKYWRSHS